MVHLKEGEVPLGRVLIPLSLFICFPVNWFVFCTRSSFLQPKEENNTIKSIFCCVQFVTKCFFNGKTFFIYMICFGFFIWEEWLLFLGFDWNSPSTFIFTCKSFLWDHQKSLSKHFWTNITQTSKLKGGYFFFTKIKFIKEYTEKENTPGSYCLVRPLLCSNLWTPFSKVFLFSFAAFAVKVSFFLMVHRCSNWTHWN